MNASSSSAILKRELLPLGKQYLESNAFAILLELELPTVVGVSETHPIWDYNRGMIRASFKPGTTYLKPTVSA